MAGINRRVKNPVHDASSSKKSNIDHLKGSYRQLQKRPFASRIGHSIGQNLGSGSNGRQVSKPTPMSAQHVGKKQAFRTPTDIDLSTSSLMDSAKLTSHNNAKQAGTGELSVEELLATDNLAGLPPAYRQTLEEAEGMGSIYDSENENQGKVFTTGECQVSADGESDNDAHGERTLSYLSQEWAVSAECTLKPEIHTSSRSLQNSPQQAIAVENENSEGMPLLSPSQSRNRSHDGCTAYASPFMASGWQEQGTATSINDGSDKNDLGMEFDRLSDAGEDNLSDNLMDSDENTGHTTDTVSKEATNGCPVVAVQSSKMASDRMTGLTSDTTKATQGKLSPLQLKFPTETPKTSPFSPHQRAGGCTIRPDSVQQNQQPSSRIYAAVDSALGTWPSFSATSTELSECPKSLALNHLRLFRSRSPACGSSRQREDSQCFSVHDQDKSARSDLQLVFPERNENCQKISLLRHQAAGSMASSQEDESDDGSSKSKRLSRNSAAERRVTKPKSYLENAIYRSVSQEEEADEHERGVDNPMSKALYMLVRRSRFKPKLSTTSSDLTDPETNLPDESIFDICDEDEDAAETQTEGSKPQAVFLCPNYSEREIREQGSPEIEYSTWQRSEAFIIAPAVDRWRAESHADENTTIEVTDDEYALERAAWDIISDDSVGDNAADFRSNANGVVSLHGDSTDDDNTFRPRIAQSLRFAMNSQSMLQAIPPDSQYWEMKTLEKQQLKDAWLSPLQERELTQEGKHNNRRWGGPQLSQFIVKDEEELSPVESPCQANVRRRTEAINAWNSHGHRTALRIRKPLASQDDIYRPANRNSVDQESEEEQESQLLTIPEPSELFDGRESEDEELLGEDGLPYVFKPVAMEVGDFQQHEEPTQRASLTEFPVRRSISVSAGKSDCNPLAEDKLASGRPSQQELPTIDQVPVTYNYPDGRRHVGLAERTANSDTVSRYMLHPANVRAGRLFEDEIVQEAVIYLTTLTTRFLNTVMEQVNHPAESID